MTKTDHYPKPPRGMSAPLRAIWRAKCAHLDALNLLTDVDLDALERYAGWMYVYRAAWADIEAHGAVVESANNKPMRNRSMTNLEVASRALTALSKQLGCYYVQGDAADDHAAEPGAEFGSDATEIAQWLDGGAAS